MALLAERVRRSCLALPFLHRPASPRVRRRSSMKAGISSPNPVTAGPRSSSRRRGSRRGASRRLGARFTSGRGFALRAGRAGGGSARAGARGARRRARLRSSRRRLLAHRPSPRGASASRAGAVALALRARPSAERRRAPAATPTPAVVLRPVDRIEALDHRSAGSAWPVSFSIASTAQRSSGIGDGEGMALQPGAAGAADAMHVILGMDAARRN